MKAGFGRSFSLTSVIKSLNLGTTVLGSDRGGLSELLPSGYLFEPNPKDPIGKILEFFDDQSRYPPFSWPSISILEQSCESRSL